MYTRYHIHFYLMCDSELPGDWEVPWTAFRQGLPGTLHGE